MAALLGEEDNVMRDMGEVIKGAKSDQNREKKLVREDVYATTTN